MSEQKIIQGDCLELLDTISNNSYDCVLTDPPYGDGFGYGRMAKEIANNEDETINYKVLPKLYDKLVEGGVCYIFTNWRFSGRIGQFIAENTQFNIRTQVVIVKNNIGMGYGFRNQYELCWVLEKGKHTYQANDFSNVQKMEHIQHNDLSHPHEKGVDLLGRMLLHVKPRNVLDPFAGTGSTLVAAKKLNIDAVGFELDERWVAVAESRLKQDLLPL